jgi:UDP-glucose 4-epimerase
MKKVIVTGGAGFIGSHTAIQLHEAGYLPVVVDDFRNSDRRMIARLEKIIGSSFPVHEIDCADRRAFDAVLDREQSVVGLIHFAANKAVGESMRNPLSYYRNNLGSLVTVLEALLARDIDTFVFSSSCTVYGQPDQLPVTEQSPIKPAESPYGRTKQMCEDIINDVVGSGAQLKAITLRYFNPVGAHPSGLIGELPIGPPENLVPYITQTAVGIREQLTIFGDDYLTTDGTCVRDYIHVVDLGRAHVRALQWLAEQKRTGFNEVFNVGTGRGNSVLEAVQAFERASGTKLTTKIGPRRAGDVIETYADVQKAVSALGWSAELSLDQAMADAYRWQLALKDNPL